MKSLAKFITRVADLAEAEGRALRQSTVAVGLAISLALAASAIGVGGLVMVAWGIFETFRAAAGFIAAAFMSGLFLMTCAGGLIWLSIRLGRPR